MTPIGWITVVIYLIGIVAIGCLFRRHRTVGDYFLAGRTLGWLPVAVSIVATDLSAISYLGCAAAITRRTIVTPLMEDIMKELRRLWAEEDGP